MRARPAALAAAAWCAALGACDAAPAAAAERLRVSASVHPGSARLGERVTYRGRVVVRPGVRAQWLPPEPDEDFTWGRLAAQRRPGRAAGAGDTLSVEVPLQVFRTGTVTIPGLRFQTRGSAGRAVHRLPAVVLSVPSVLGAGDSAADLRPMRGPMAAPWWERVPWPLVAAVLALLLAAVAVIRRLRRPRPAVAAPAAPQPVSIRDPATVALAELRALRGLELPAHGRFGEHAFHLSRIVRRFLEATVHTPLPGDTTGELLAHLESTALGPDDLEALAGLLRVWDGLKFARAASSAEESARAEQAVEALIRRVAPPPAAAERVA